MKDEVDGPGEYVWGVSTLTSVDEAARAVNALLPPGRKAIRIDDNFYVRSEQLMFTDAQPVWSSTLNHRRPPKNGVLKVLVVEWVPSIDNDPPEGRTWIACGLHGTHFPKDLLAAERPDIGWKGNR